MLRDITNSDQGRRGRRGRAIVIAVAAAILAAIVIAVQPRTVVPVSSPHPSPHPLPRSAGLMAADLSDPSNLWLTTGSANSAPRLWWSQDGGQTWTSVGLPLGRADIVWLHFLDPNRGYLVYTGLSEGGGDMLSITDDGGLHWRTYSLPVPANSRLDSITFTHDGQGRALFVAGDGSSGLQGAYFYTSSDGRQWRLDASVDSTNRDANGLTFDGGKGPIAFADAMHGVMASAGRGAYVTADGGLHWSFRAFVAPPGEYPRGPNPITVAAVDGSYLVGWAYRALNSQAAAFTYWSFDGGTSWSAPVSLPTEDGATAPVFAGSQVWWVASGKSVSMTSDGGRHWLTTALALPGTIRVSALYPLDDKRAWAFAGGTVAPPQLLYETIDGGSTWSVMKPPG